MARSARLASAGGPARVGLLHYTCPPVVGGVETILYEQATRLSARGYPVTVISGRGGPLPGAPTLPSPRGGGEIRLVMIPEIDSRHPEVSELRDQLMRGQVPAAFDRLKIRIEALLQPHLNQLDVVIAHNVLSLHFNLPLTAALWTIADSAGPPFISWMHDLSWVNPLYRPWLHDAEPWDLLRRQHPRITPVFVSTQRMNEWRSLTGAAVDASNVIPNGIDPMALLKLGAGARSLASRFNLLDTDVLMLAPVRITKRKNLEWAIDAAAGVRDAGRSVQLLVTGPPGPHNPRSHEYVAELQQLIERRDLHNAVRFLFQLTEPTSGDYAIDPATLSDLYMLSDVVVLPSMSEGFGLPLAEAAVFRVPVVCTDLPAFLELAPEGAIVVPIEAGSAAFTAAVLQAIDTPSARLRRHVLDALSWDRLLAERIEPLLAATT